MAERGSADVGATRAELFRLESVSVIVDGRAIVDDVTVDFPAGRLTVLGGPSGAGKTTLLRLLNRLDVPTSGSVSLRGVDLAEVDPLTLRRDVAMVFQLPPLFPGTVADNLRVSGGRLTEAELAASLEAVGLSARTAEQDAATLSVGEAQRMCFGRALLTRPTVILADEPTSALDPSPRRALEDLTRELVAGGLSVVWISHDADQVRRIADHLVVLDEGRLVAAGSPSQLHHSHSPVVRSVLAGEP